MANQLNWLIFGAGAIGTYIGGSLIMHGQKVVFLERAEIIPEILERGLRLNLHGQEHRILHPTIFSSLQEVFANSPVDIVIFALKSYDTHNALDEIRNLSHEFPPIICLQNGVENEPTIATVLGENKVIAGTVTSAISRRAAGDIFLERFRGIGIAATHSLSSMVVDALSEARLNAHLYSSALALKWSKLLTNLLCNASSAILDLRPSEILSHPALYSIEVAQLREAISVCQTNHIPIINLPGTPVKLFAWMMKLHPNISRQFISWFAGKGRGEKMPSFHVDLYSGRDKSEVDYLNGAVVRFGERSHIPTPINHWLNQTLLGLVNGTAPIDEYKHQPQKYLDYLNIYIEQEQELSNSSVK